MTLVAVRAETMKGRGRRRTDHQASKNQAEPAHRTDHVQDSGKYHCSMKYDESWPKPESTYFIYKSIHVFTRVVS